MFGQANHRPATSGDSIGIHTLTIAMATATTTTSRVATPRAQACRSPSVFLTIQVAPSRP